MLLVYKMLSEKDSTATGSLFHLASDGPRNTRCAAGPLNVRAKHGRLEVRRNFFSVRVTESWNRVPAEIKMLKSVQGFKNAYKEHRKRA